MIKNERTIVSSAALERGRVDGRHLSRVPVGTRAGDEARSVRRVAKSTTGRSETRCSFFNNIAAVWQWRQKRADIDLIG